jgi:hypothetical protein
MPTDIAEPIKKDYTLNPELMFERAGRKAIYMKFKGLSGD